MTEYVSKETLQAKLNRKKAGPANKRYTEGWNDAILMVKSMIHSEKAADVAPVRHGRWILEVHDERVNYRWNVTAECSECCNEKKEIWAGFFAYIVPSIARSVALTSAKRVKLSNYCPNCGAKMEKMDLKV